MIYCYIVTYKLPMDLNFRFVQITQIRNLSFIMLSYEYQFILKISNN